MIIVINPIIIGNQFRIIAAIIVQGNQFGVVGENYVLVYEGKFWSREGSG